MEKLERGTLFFTDILKNPIIIGSYVPAPPAPPILAKNINPNRKINPHVS